MSTCCALRAQLTVTNMGSRHQESSYPCDTQIIEHENMIQVIQQQRDGLQDRCEDAAMRCDGRA